ncbi:Crp/Fnr family transcriptional regulator [Beijerinckia sp. L45]|uniref:Crp/Fnr family transcriptional regulator n=1 Tax=Beijerinckia sp. L45 TaxID=1641855 RepID=UPI00131B4C95|nr:Crp/Fnr family transcriptional regulator [Beijerinckia sp. L45]
MTTNDNDAFTRMIRKLDRLANLSEIDREAIRALPFRIEAVPPDHLLVREGQEATDCCILLNGYACRHKTTSGGRRQIVSFHIPGDILDLQHLLLSRADHNIQAITDVAVAWFPAADVKTLAQARPAVSEAMWRDSLIDASVFREWVLNVGRRDAKARITHMLCEFAARREAAGLGSPERFELPFTQEQIGDATGLTAIHVNRILHKLVQDGVLVRDRTEVEIMNWDRMREIADFDPNYLHMAA